MESHPIHSSASISMWRWWPCFIGGLCVPIIAEVGARWIAHPIAVGIALFVMWFVVGIVFTISPPSSRWNLFRWVRAGAIGSIIAGILDLIFHIL